MNSLCGGAQKFFLVLSLTCSCFWIRTGVAAEKVIFAPGQEYTYSYDTLVTTGTEEPTGYAAAYKINGRLRIQATSSNIFNAKLDDLTIGLYNGPWSYFPLPTFQLSSNADLSSLSEPFQVQLQNGKFKLIVMNDQEQEWASNMKRGLAAVLQLPDEAVAFDKVSLLKVNEATTMGECETHYEVLPPAATKTPFARISKFRNHADCPDMPTRTRLSTRIFYPCPDKNTQNVLNSTAYTTYDIDNSDASKVTVKQIQTFSSVLYWPFTTKAPYLYSWYNMTMALSNVGPISNPITAPENSESHEDLSFVFEQNDLNDPEEENQDFRSAEPLMFHHTAGENDPEVLQGIMDQLHTTVSNVAKSLIESSSSNLDEDLEKFHRNSPFAIIPLISSLDLENLKHCFHRYSGAAKSGGQQQTIELQLFLDGLLLSGNWPSTLAVRDIIVETDDNKILARLIPSFPHFIRNPTESLAKELEPIFELSKKAGVSNSLKRLVELSVASAVSKCCAKSNCSTSGILDKYINYFEEKLADQSFEVQTVGVNGLRNLGVGRSLDKLLEIAQGSRVVPTSVRVQAIWSLRPLGFRSRDQLFDALLPVFYNRAEPCEVRTSVFGLLMSVHPDKRILHEIAYYMWTETCPQTANIVRSTLMNIANSQHPCNPSKSHAETVLKYLPPGKVDPTRTCSYAVDYYDQEHGFGHMVYATVQKSSKTALPLSVYIGLNGYVGGFASAYLGLYIRMEGLGKTITSKIAALRNANIEKIQSILGKIGVKERSSTPLKLEIVLQYHEKVIIYYAADERTIDRLPQFLKKLGDLKSSLSLDWERSLLIGGVLYQQPMELGVPISVLTGITAIGSLSANFTRSSGGGLLSQDSKTRLQFNTFGLTRIANHVPGIGATFKVTHQRTLRLVVPKQVNLGLDIKNKAINFAIKPPTEEDPVLAVAHATTRTAVSSDVLSTGKDLKVLELLKSSCPNCVSSTIVSKGKAFRKSRVRDFKLPWVKGLKSTFKYFDCERDHSKRSVALKFQHFFNPSNKNDGIFKSPLIRTALGLHQARDAIFYSPYGETCGVSLSFGQDTKDGVLLENIEAKLKGNVDLQTSKMAFDTTLSLKYGSSSSVQSTTFEAFINLLEKGLEESEFTIKVLANQQGDATHPKNNKAAVACLNLQLNANHIPKDILCFQGENEPFVKETIRLQIGKLSPDQLAGKDTPCLDNHAEVTLKAEAHQSSEQKLEAKQDVYPYKQCRDQKKSPLYPGNFVPPSPECYLAVTEQTKLRSANVSISYKVNRAVRDRWRRPLALLQGLLIPYRVHKDEENEDADAENQLEDHAHEKHEAHSAVAKRSGFYTGEIEYDINVKKNEPTADVHFHGGIGGGAGDGQEEEEEHYHGIDLNLLPSILKLEPLPGRFSPLIVLGVKLGAFGVCSVTPEIVHTFDGAAVPGKVSNCLTLVSADCGKNPQYAILAKKTSAETLAVEVHIGEQTINLEGANSIKLNGQAQNWPDRVFQYLPSHVQVLKNGEEVFISSKASGLFVRYTGSFVTVTAGSRYRGVQCGLCGEWDSSPYNDLRGPDNTCKAIFTPQGFFDSYVEKGAGCEAASKTCPA